MIEIKVGNYYTLNEDIKNLWTLKEGADTTPIKAGTKCKVVELNGEYKTDLYVKDTKKTYNLEDADVTLKFETGQRVRTETHMID